LYSQNHSHQNLANPYSNSRQGSIDQHSISYNGNMSLNKNNLHVQSLKHPNGLATLPTRNISPNEMYRDDPETRYR